MNATTFSLSTREEVLRFEELLHRYIEAQTQLPLKHISLVDAYDKTLTRENGGRIFAALLDIQITFFLLYLDMHMAGATWNTTFSKGKPEGDRSWIPKTNSLEKWTFIAPIPLTFFDIAHSGTS